MIIWFIILIVNGIDGLRDGAPESACTTLRPRHSGFAAQTNIVPYAIHAELSDRKVSVTISSPVGEVFQGFILQARSRINPSKFIDGEFTTSQISKAINCFDSNKNTLTHVSPSQKTEIQTEWTPKEQLSEEVIFRASVAKQFETFWTDVDSNPVNMMRDSSTVISEKSRYEKCFKEEGCVGLPDGCVAQQDCEILLTYSSASDGINFNLQGLLEGSETNYIAMAWSEDNKMGNDSVIECINDGTNVIARGSWNEGKSNTRTKELSSDSYTGTFVDGLTSCSWKSPLITESNGRTYDFTNNSFYILLATGKVDGSRLKYHTDRIYSSKALSLIEFHEDEEVTEPEVESTSRDTGVQQPSVTPEPETDSTSHKEESFIHTNETISTSSSSCLRGSCLFFLAMLLFTSKKIINDYIF